MSNSAKRYRERHEKLGLCQYCNKKAVRTKQGRLLSRCRDHIIKQRKHMKNKTKSLKYKKQGGMI